MEDKPLPAVPPAQARLTTLTVESRAHLSRLIQHALAEEKLGPVDSWANQLLKALDDLGDSISHGNWLSGLRQMRQHHRERARARATLKKIESAVDVRGKGKEHEKEKEKIGDSANAKLDPKASKTNLGEDRDASGAASSKRTEDQQDMALQQLADLLAKPYNPSPKPPPKHLLLTLSAQGSVLPLRDLGFDLIPTSNGCTFSPGIFAFPAHDVVQGRIGTVLYGAREWDVDDYDSIPESLRIVGGTFSFQGVSTVAQYRSLSKVLRFSVFVFLSLLLEQHLLSDFGVPLHFPPPRLSLPSVSPKDSPRYLVPRVVPEASPRSHLPKSPSGIWSYLSKKTENFLTRASLPIRPAAPTSRVHPSSPTPAPPPTPSPLTPRESAADRPRRLSFNPPNARKSPSESSSQPDTDPKTRSTFTSLAARVEQKSFLLTASSTVRLAPPRLIVTLASKEEAVPGRRLRSDERAGLRTLLGWEGREAALGGAFAESVAAFVRHQGFMALHSSHIIAPSSTDPAPSAFVVPVPRQAQAESTSASAHSVSSASSSSTAQSATSVLTSASNATTTTATAKQDPSACVQCATYQWITSRFYSRTHDRSLGEAVQGLCGDAGEPCHVPGCKALRGQHELRWVHDGVQISARVRETEKGDGSHSGSAGEDDGEARIEMWMSCSLCHKSTAKLRMSDGTYLASFAKFLEQLTYSPTFYNTQSPMCEHVHSPAISMKHRFNIVRLFSFKAHTVAFSLMELPDVFEACVPRLQSARDTPGEKTTMRSVSSQSSRSSQPVEEEAKRVLRREIKVWWQGLADHLDVLEDQLMHDSPTSFRKALPRLPSVDEAYDYSPPPSPKLDIASLPPLPPSIPSTPAMTPSTGEDLPPVMPIAVYPPPDSEESSRLLLNLRHSFQGVEQTLYAQLAQTPPALVNDVRRAFRSSARGAAKRVGAWQVKHAANAKTGKFQGELKASEPEWWSGQCHPVPGGHVIVREQEFSTMIAFTLSSQDYLQELERMSRVRTSSETSATSVATSTQSPPPSIPSTPALSVAPSAKSSTTSYFTSSPMKFFKSPRAPDPDQEGPAWHIDEVCSAVISRKEHPRDPSALLSIRGVLRQQRSMGTDDSDNSLLSRFSGLRSPLSMSRMRAGIPPSAWAKPAVEVDTQNAGGLVSGLPEPGQSAEQILHDYDSEIVMVGSHPSEGSSYSSESTSTAVIVTHIARRHTASVSSSTDSDDSTSTIGPEDRESITPTVPSKLEQTSSTLSSATIKPSKPNGATAAVDPGATTSSFTNVFTNGITNVTNVMKQILNPESLPSTPNLAAKNHHTLLVTDSVPIDDQPHIKYDWTIGQRLRFSCTVYYAKQFDALRKRCGVDDVFTKSLECSTNWSADGGKSKSNFWKTADDRFIIKTLVNAWNVADLQVLIEIAPSYFRYMDTTSNRPSVLAKLLGFYTVEIRNLETGSVQAKADLLVMENLFFEQNVSRTFDLKGIQGRKVKAKAGLSSTRKTLFDGEWLEGQQRALLLIRAYSKFVLREALRSDAEYLAKSNIMDYSLLLGVDEERKQIACGVVDTIGSYTFAKTLEYKAKQGLNAGKEVTVIPPNEYQERFLNAMENYFVACPDKWSKPMDDVPISDDYRSLPSVL